MRTLVSGRTHTDVLTVTHQIFYGKLIDAYFVANIDYTRLRQIFSGGTNTNRKMYLVSPEGVILLANAMDAMVAYLPQTVQNACQCLTGPAGDEDIIEKVLRYLDQHYMENVSLAKTAQSVYFSEHHFCRYFKEQTGVTPKEYRNQSLFGSLDAEA